MSTAWRTIRNSSPKLNGDIASARCWHTNRAKRPSSLRRWPGWGAGWSDGDFPTVASLKTRWLAEEMKLMAFVDGLTEQRLTAEFDYISTEGNPHRRVVMVHSIAARPPPCSPLWDSLPAISI